MAPALDLIKQSKLEGWFYADTNWFVSDIKDRMSRAQPGLKRKFQMISLHHRTAPQMTWAPCLAAKQPGNPNYAVKLRPCDRSLITWMSHSLVEFLSQTLHIPQESIATLDTCPTTSTAHKYPEQSVKLRSGTRHWMPHKAAASRPHTRIGLTNGTLEYFECKRFKRDSG